MSTVCFGDYIYEIVNSTRNSLYDEGELAQLTYNAFEITANDIESKSSDEIEVNVPIGYRADKNTITTRKIYKKYELIQRHKYLANHKLAKNAILQLVTTMEVMLNDLIRAVILKYPNKLSSKKQISVASIIGCTSIEEIHQRAVDLLVNEMSYKSPKEYSEYFNELISINLL